MFTACAFALAGPTVLRHCFIVLPWQIITTKELRQLPPSDVKVPAAAQVDNRPPTTGQPSYAAEAAFAVPA
jgi:hypothetical protein